MKALQAKRNSLRSFWRRSLVILSIVALAFAFGCSNETTTTETIIVPGDPLMPRAAVAMRVLTSPSNWSFQGNIPDLVGIRVELDYGGGETEIIDNPALFFTYPVRCEEHRGTRDDGTRFNEFRLFHYGSNSLNIPVFLPGVVELQSVRVDGNTSIKEWFEDMPQPNLTAGTVSLFGNYVRDGNIIGRPIPFFENRDYYNIVGGDNPKVVYTVAENKNGVPPGREDPIEIEFRIETFWKVDRVEYVEGSGSTGTALIPDSPVPADPAAAAVFWMSALEAAGVQLHVHYLNRIPFETRTMADYRRAHGLGKAAHPVLAGTNGGNVQALWQAYEAEGELVVRLQYYAPDATGNNFTGDTHHPNTAIVPLTEEFILYTYSYIDVTRIPATTGHDGAQVIYGTAGGRYENLLEDLRKYWLVEYVYVHPNNPALERRTTVSEALFKNGAVFGGGPAAWDGLNNIAQLEDPEGVILRNQEMELAILLPRSAQDGWADPAAFLAVGWPSVNITTPGTNPGSASTGGREEVTVTYDILP